VVKKKRRCAPTKVDEGARKSQKKKRDASKCEKVENTAVTVGALGGKGKKNWPRAAGPEWGTNS